MTRRSKWAEQSGVYTSPAVRPHLSISTASTFDADSCDLASVTLRPTDEKSRSDCAELAETTNTRLATADIIFDCCRQYWTGVVVVDVRSILYSYAESSASTDKLVMVMMLMMKIQKYNDAI